MVYPVGGGKGNKFAPGTSPVRVPNPLKSIVMLLVEKYREAYGFQPDPEGIGLMIRVVEAINSQKSVDISQRNMEILSDAIELEGVLREGAYIGTPQAEIISRILLKYEGTGILPSPTEESEGDAKYDDLGSGVTQKKVGHLINRSQQRVSQIKSILPLVLDRCKDITVTPQTLASMRKELNTAASKLLDLQTKLAKKEQKIQQLEKRIAASNIPASEEETIAVIEQKLEETVDSLKKILKGDDPGGRNFKTSKQRPITARIQDLVTQTEQWLKFRGKN